MKIYQQYKKQFFVYYFPIVVLYKVNMCQKQQLFIFLSQPMNESYRYGTWFAINAWACVIIFEQCFFFQFKNV